jgi:hypothetical protein
VKDPGSAGRRKTHDRAGRNSPAIELRLKTAPLAGLPARVASTANRFPIIGYWLLAPPATLSRSDCGRVSAIREAVREPLKKKSLNECFPSIVSNVSLYTRNFVES